MTLSEFFNNYNIEINNEKLIIEAFTHSSYANEHNFKINNNERLEFLGDAILQFWISDQLYNMKKKEKEGQMTLIRSKLVCEEALASYSRKLKLNRFLRLGLGEKKTGGLDRDSILADMFEAVLGAIYLDSNFENVDKFLKLVINVEDIDGNSKDYKSLLQEYIQSDTRETISYEVVSINGTNNNPIFEIVVKVDGIIMGKGVGSSKKKAEQNAACEALKKVVT